MASFGSADESVQVLIGTKADTKGIKDTDDALDKLNGTSGKSHLSFLKLTGAVAAGQAAFTLAKHAISDVSGFLTSSVKSYSDSENAAAQLKTVLDSTHGAAGLYIEDLQDQATALQKMTTYSDEAISSAQSLLLTFTNVKGGVFQESIGTILDMSTALGQDLKSSTIQVGKALNDPIKGITALSRVGVSFTEKQKEQIETLVKSGKTMDAQRIILKELSTEFGGSASAAGKTFAGSMERLKNQVDDVKESLGKVIIDGITPFVGKAAEFVSKVDWESVIARSVAALKDMANYLKNVAEQVYAVYQKIEKYLQPKFEALWHTIRDDLAPALKEFYEGVIKPLIPILGTLLVGAIGLVTDAVNLLFTVISPLLDFLGNHVEVVQLLTGAFIGLAIALNIVPAVTAVTTALTTMQTVTIPALMTQLGYLGAAFVTAIPVLAVLAALGVVINKYQETMRVIDETNAHINAANGSIDQAQRKMQGLANTGGIALDQLYKFQNSVGNTPTGSQVFKQGNSYLAGFASGGYTGSGGENEVAGVVHKGEYVVPKSQVDQSTGEPKGMGTTINISNVQLTTPEAVKALFQLQDFSSLLVAKGGTPIRM